MSVNLADRDDDYIVPMAGSQYAAAHPETAHFGLMYEWHGSRYLGAAHGLVGICHTLLLCPRTVRFPLVVDCWLTVCTALLGRGYCRCPSVLHSFAPLQHCRT